MLDARLSEIDNAVADLLALRRALLETRRRAEDCADDRPVTVCSIIEGS